MLQSCKHFQECEFVLLYVAKVKPHWDDFVSLYCRGDFQDVCKRNEWMAKHGRKPVPELMPTGRRVPELVENAKQGPV